MQSTTIAVDLAKSVFEIAVSRFAGKVAERHRLSRTKFLRFFAQREAARVLLEACGSAHHWAQELGKLGHEVVLFPPHLVRPYRRRHKKTDRTDAKALLEADRNEEIEPVPIKTVEQRGLAALHRLRSAWMETRTARLNGVRGLLREHGHFIPRGAKNVVPRVRELIADDANELPDPMRVALAEACEEIRELERRCASVCKQLEALAATIPAVAHLLSVPGIWPADRHRDGGVCRGDLPLPLARRFASYLGVTPRVYATARCRIRSGLLPVDHRRGQSESTPLRSQLRRPVRSQSPRCILGTAAPPSAQPWRESGRESRPVVYRRQPAQDRLEDENIRRSPHRTGAYPQGDPPLPEALHRS